MNERTKKSNDYNSAANKAISLLKPYQVKSPIIALPDFTDSNSLPIGTTAVIGNEMPINPALIGMDIGCGYLFFSAQMNPRRFYKKGRLRTGSVEAIVSAITSQLAQSKAGQPEIGKGNHFIDVFVPEDIYDKQACEDLGIREDAVYFMIHSGSRTRGFDVHSAFSQRFKNLKPADSQRFNHDYLAAFNEARSFAQRNRQALKQLTEKALSELHERPIDTRTLYDKPHNDIEIISNGQVDYKLKKGSSSLQPGELFVIPSNATSPAFGVIGDEGLEQSYFTINHGAGRKYTRQQTLARYRKQDLDSLFESVVLSVNPKQMVEEVPAAYKKIEDIIASVEEFRLGRKVFKLRPIGIIVDRENNNERK